MKIEQLYKDRYRASVKILDKEFDAYGLTKKQAVYKLFDKIEKIQIKACDILNDINFKR